VDEGPKLRRRGRETAPDAPGGTSARYSGGALATPVHITAVARTDEPSLEHHRSGATADARPQRGLQLTGLNVSREYCHQTISAFISDIFPLGTLAAQSSFLGTWLWHVPPYLGRHAFLDAAALSLALVYFSRQSRDQMLLRRAELSYGAALKSLATVVAEPRKGLSAEVLCAVLLLGHFEVRRAPPPPPRGLSAASNITPPSCRRLFTEDTLGFVMLAELRTSSDYGELANVMIRPSSTPCFSRVAEPSSVYPFRFAYYYDCANATFRLPKRSLPGSHAFWTLMNGNPSRTD